MVYYNPYIPGWYNPLYNPTNMGFVSLLTCTFHPDSIVSPSRIPMKAEVSTSLKVIALGCCETRKDEDTHLEFRVCFFFGVFCFVCLVCLSGFVWFCVVFVFFCFVCLGFVCFDLFVAILSTNLLEHVPLGYSEGELL